jgi:6,7-dimethyl-8-ribityllumazine synthase
MVKQFKIGLVVSEFNYDITKLMLEKAVSHAGFLGIKVEAVIRVPGTFEIPIAVKRLLKRSDLDGVVTLGAVIKGETKHDELIANQVARKVLDLALEADKPVSLGIIGPGATHEQAVSRIEEYSVRAIESVVKTIMSLDASAGNQSGRGE